MELSVTCMACVHAGMPHVVVFMQAASHAASACITCNNSATICRAQQ
jgi:hypothetical protein